MRGCLLVHNSDFSPIIKAAHVWQQNGLDKYASVNVPHFQPVYQFFCILKRYSIVAIFIGPGQIVNQDENKVELFLAFQEASKQFNKTKITILFIILRFSFIQAYNYFKGKLGEFFMDL